MKQTIIKEFDKKQSLKAFLSEPYYKNEN